MSAAFQLLTQLQEIHRDLREAIDESLSRFWEANDGILHLMDTLPRSGENADESAIHFAAVSAWIGRFLFSNRSRPLASPGALKTLSDLEKKIEPMHHALKCEAPHAALVGATLGILSLTPGIANLPLRNLAAHLEWILDEGSINAGKEFPVTLLSSVAAIASHLESRVVIEEADSSLDIAEVETGPESIDALELGEF
ncbi:MAG: hypothetical protein ACI8T1_000886 [Verrucomicrobiales bacterium]